MKRALVLSLICVVGLAFAGFGQTLTGSWITEVCLDPQTASFADAISLDSVLTVTYGIGDWAFTSVTSMTGAGWDDQTFSVSGLFGLITVASALDFGPTGTFDSWDTTLGLSMAGVDFTAVFSLEPLDSQLDLSLVAGLGSAVEGSIDIVFGGEEGCDFDFTSVAIGLDFLFCDCAPIETTILFDCTNGFVSFTAATGGIAIPNLPWVTIGAELVFTLTDKELTITPAFDFGPIVCFDLDFAVVESGGQTFPGDTLILSSIEIVGIGIGCTIGGVEFYAYSDLDTTLAPEDIWEYYTIGLDADACCGGVFEFDAYFGFNDAGLTLFNLAVVEIDMKVNVTEQFAFTMGLDVDLAGGFTSWCLGFEVTW
jgi:hypothetical protein